MLGCLLGVSDASAECGLVVGFVVACSSTGDGELVDDWSDV
jgi:hypothetical protein